MSVRRQKNDIAGSISNINVDLDSVTSRFQRRKNKLHSFLHSDRLSGKMVRTKEDGNNRNERSDRPQNFHLPSSSSSVIGMSCGKDKRNMKDMINRKGERTTECGNEMNLDNSEDGVSTNNQIEGDLKSCKTLFSSQMALIGIAAQRITSDIKEIEKRIVSQREPTRMNNTERKLDLQFSMPTRRFIIGFTTCKYPAPIALYKDRCEFVYYHPHESSEIQMIIWYRDMISRSYSNCKFSFKLNKRLSHFPVEYDPNNPLHTVVIELMSKDALRKVRKCIRSFTKS